MNTWQQENAQHIKQRLLWLRQKEDGILIRQQKQEGGDSLLVIKSADDIALYFMMESKDTEKPIVSGVMSRIDIRDPLCLHGVNQAMMLSALWLRKDQPSYVYVMGFGGGRVPMLLHHCFPQAHIHSSESDQEVMDLAEMCFGIDFDDRMSVTVQDGKSHLEQSNTPYNIIVIDCFVDEGIQPAHLGTQEFYELCRSRLSLNGVVCINLASTDPNIKEKRAAFSDVFEHSYSVHYNYNYVLFGCQTDYLDGLDIEQTAQTIQEDNDLDFPLALIASTLVKEPLIKRA